MATPGSPVTSCTFFFNVSSLWLLTVVWRTKFRQHLVARKGLLFQFVCFRNSGAAYMGVSGLVSLVRLKPGCRQGLQSSEGLTCAGGAASKRLACSHGQQDWLSACPDLCIGPLLCPDNVSYSRAALHERKESRTTEALWPSLWGHTLSFPQCPITSTTSFIVGGDYTRAWNQGARINNTHMYGLKTTTL